MTKSKTPPQGQGPGAAAGAAPPDPSGPTPSPPAQGPGAAPKFCPSDGKPLSVFAAGKAGYCDDCEHVFDEGGQGRKADFKDQLHRMQDEIAALKAGGSKDPRVDKLDEVVKKLTGDLTGTPRGIDDIDPKNGEQMGKLAAGLAMLKVSFGAFFKPRPKPAPAALPGPAPAQGAK